jgi:hypothetical protein
VLDSAFLDVKLVENGYPTTVEIGIGDNLLIYPWIKRLVRMNKAFTVRRGLSLRETLAASQLMSRYIHFAVTQKKENIWIAQREGRAKDSDDRTQEAVLKMLAMGGDLQELNIVPLTISYEYDPCDYLKAKEMQQKRDNPDFRKAPNDDLVNMRTGIFGWKGEVHYKAAPCLNEWLSTLDPNTPNNDIFLLLRDKINEEIHRNYKLFPSNYIAAEMLRQLGVRNEEIDYDPANAEFTAHYTPSQCAEFEKYLSQRIALVDLDNPDTDYLRREILLMYANPLYNYYKATGEK